MSEIQKFKENRKILKGQYGLKSHEVLGGRINGMPVAYVNIPGKGYIAVDQKGNAYRAVNEGSTGVFHPNLTTFEKINLTNYDRGHIYKAATRNDGMTSFGLAQASRIADYWAKQGAPKSIVKPAPKLITIQEDKQTPAEDTVTTKTGRTGRTGTGTGRTGKSAIKVTPKGQAYWDKQYQDFKSKMTDDQKAWLDQRGIDYNSAEQLQGYLSRIGKNIGKFGIDNKWGGDSQKAWEDFVNTTMKNNPLQTPVDEPILDQPDLFGYKTSNTYEGDDFANKVKALGIRSNADLINFMYKSGKEGWKGDAWQTQFRSDVDRLLGGDYSDKNIRKVFKTKNGWNNGFMGRGDFGDFQNVLQTNAGVWNGMYDAKQNEARMDAARQQYAAKLSQQFTPQLSKPTVDNPSNKFMVGNIGATTLGNLPSTKPINLSQEFTKDVKELNIPSEVSVVYKPGTSDWLDWAQ